MLQAKRYITITFYCVYSYVYTYNFSYLNIKPPFIFCNGGSCMNFNRIFFLYAFELYVNINNTLDTWMIILNGSFILVMRNFSSTKYYLYHQIYKYVKQIDFSRYTIRRYKLCQKIKDSTSAFEKCWSSHFLNIMILPRRSQAWNVFIYCILNGIHVCRLYTTLLLLSSCLYSMDAVMTGEKNQKPL